jgi:hypothetical protein
MKFLTRVILGWTKRSESDFLEQIWSLILSKETWTYSLEDSKYFKKTGGIQTLESSSFSKQIKNLKTTVLPLRSIRKVLRWLLTKQKFGNEPLLSATDLLVFAPSPQLGHKNPHRVAQNY